MSLQAKLTLRFLVGLVVIGAMFFLPAGSFRFWQGWSFLAIWFVPGLAASIYFLEHDRQLVERRLLTKEKVPEQKLIIRFLFVIYFIALLLPGFDHRFGWSHVPIWLTIASQSVVLGGYLLTIWVMKVNSFASRTIQVEPGQRVISAGPYHVVRHPMYSGLILMLLFTSTALGSYVALPAFLLMVPLIILRLLNEEKILRQDLPGYTEYCRRTHYRLVPLLW